MGVLCRCSPVPWPEPDPQIAAAIKAMYGSRKTERPLAVEIRDRMGQWLADDDFAAAFGIRGRPGWPPSRLALVTVLQRAEKLTDRLAAEAVRAGWTGSTCCYRPNYLTRVRCSTAALFELPAGYVAWSRSPGRTPARDTAPAGWPAGSGCSVIWARAGAVAGWRARSAGCCLAGAPARARAAGAGTG